MSQNNFLQKVVIEPESIAKNVNKFVEGNHAHLHDWLGAHVTNHGTIFRVWAPGAKSVSVMLVIGNETINRRMQLQRHGIWTCFITKLGFNAKYKYEITTQDNQKILKSDPFGFYHDLEPYFDTIIYDRYKYVWRDEQYLIKRKSEDFQSAPMAIYEVHLGSWKKTTDDKFLTYKQYADKLIKYVKETGYTHIELLPLAEHPFLGSWGYQITGYFAATSRYGKPDELKYLIDLAHYNNIKVIMDFVPVHFNKDDHGLYRFDGTHTVFSSPIEYDRENVLWGTANFDLGKNEVQSFLLSSLTYWIEDFHVDGFRFDAVSYILYHQGNTAGKLNTAGVSFIKNTITQIKKRHPDVLLIAEDSSNHGSVTKPITSRGLGFDLKWDLGFSNDLFRFMQRPFDERRFAPNAFNDITFSVSYNSTERFLLPFSHDEVVHLKKSLVLKSPGFYDQQIRQSKLMIGFMFGRPGKKLLFMGLDFAQNCEWNEQISLDWHLLEDPVHAKHLLFVKDLLRVYKRSNPLFERDFDQAGFEWVCVHENNNVFSFKRFAKKTDDELLMIYNFSDQYFEHYNIYLKNDATNRQPNYVYYEILNSDNLKYGGTGAINSMTKDPGVIPIQKNEHQTWIDIKLAPFAAIFLKKAFVK